MIKEYYNCLIHALICLFFCITKWIVQGYVKEITHRRSLCLILPPLHPIVEWGYHKVSTFSISYVSKTLFPNISISDIYEAIIWKLVETCIIPIITYGAESRTTTHKESQKIQTIMNNIIKIILQVPQSTPNDAITIETGIPNIQTITEIKTIEQSHENKQNGPK